MRPCISITGSIRPSVGPSVCRSVRPLVRNPLRKNFHQCPCPIFATERVVYTNLLVAKSNSIRGFVPPSVGRSLGWSEGLSVRHFPKTANSTKFKGIQHNSTKSQLFTTVGRIILKSMNFEQAMIEYQPHYSTNHHHIQFNFAHVCSPSEETLFQGHSQNDPHHN